MQDSPKETPIFTLDNVSLSSWKDGWNDPYNYTIDGKVVMRYNDTLAVPSLSWIIIGVYTLAILILTPLIIVRRNKQPIKARNYILMLILMFSHYFALLFTTLRLGVGRWRYPCLFYSPVFSLLVPCAFMPSILRMWRLFFIFRISKIKIRLAGFKKQQQQQSNGSNSSDIELHDGDNVRSKMNNFYSWRNQTTTANRGFSDRLDRVLFGLQNIWVSNSFMLSVIFAVFLIHVVIWIIVLFTTWNIKDVFNMQFACVSTMRLTIITGLQIFFYLGIELILLLLLYVFKVRDKWGVRLEVTISLSQMIVFLGVGILFTGLNDYIYVEGERYWPAIFFGIIAFFIDLVWVNIVPLVQSFMAKNNRSVKQDDTNNSDNDAFSLIQVLEDDDFRSLYKQFCAASLVVEPICFYEDNKSFNDPSNIDNGALIFEAKQIIEKYCLDYSPLLLNLENKEKLIKPIRDKLVEYEARLLLEQQDLERWVDPNLFQGVNIACLHDMQSDTFSRFKSCKTYSQYIKNKRKMDKSKKIVGAD